MQITEMSGHDDNQPQTYGLVALFETPEALYEAAERTRDAGYTKTDAHTPFPVHGLAQALGMPRSKLSTIIFIGGCLGFCGGLGLQYWVSVLAYPVNVAGRPLVSWPSWIPVTFECTVLAAALTAFIAMITLNKLPEPYHAVFNTPGFERASNDGFFLTIEAIDPRFDAGETRAFLEAMGPVEVYDVSP